jgi:hypothetical protein
MARLLKQQWSITIYRLPAKENKLPFSVLLQQTNKGLPFPFSICSKTKRSCRFSLVPFPFTETKFII